MLNESTGNMYAFITHTINFVKGICPHGCSYCFMKNKKFKLKDVRLDSKEMKTDLGSHNFIFVGSSCDMWADEIPGHWILQIIQKCIRYENKYLFQSKNPYRFCEFYMYGLEGKNVIFGTTIESNRDYEKLPPEMQNRIDGISRVAAEGHRITVTIEPIMDFDMDEFVEIMDRLTPEWISIGADSKGNDLVEPGPDKINELIRRLRDVSYVVVKDNLRRLMK